MTRRQSVRRFAALPAELETARLLLRPFRQDDLEDVHAYGSDPQVCRFMTWGPNTPEESRAFLERRLAEQTDPLRSDHSYAVELEGRVVGAFALMRLDAAHRTVELGYTLHRACWGRGLAVEASAALIDAAFGRRGCIASSPPATCATAGPGG